MSKSDLVQIVERLEQHVIQTRSENERLRQKVNRLVRRLNRLRLKQQQGAHF